MSTEREKTLLDYLNELTVIRAQIKELQGEEEAYTDLIKEEMTANGEDELLVGDYKLTYREVVSNRFDSTTFKKSYSDLYKLFTKTTTYKRLTIN